MAVDIVLCERDQPHRVLLADVLEVEGYGVAVTASVDHAVERWRRADVKPLLVVEMERFESSANPQDFDLAGQARLLALIPETSTERALHAFRVGADAVLPKHADTGLLVAQVRALLRHDANRDSRFAFHGFLLDTAAETLQHEGQEVDLTPRSSRS